MPKTILKTLNDRGYDAYFVGGCVRDQVLGIPPKDWDIATNALPHEVREVFPEAKFIDPAQSFPVCSLRGFEIATFREDLRAKGRHDVAVQAVRDYVTDAHRRDLTINALYQDVDDKIYDPTRLGLRDIRAGKIRMIGSPSARIQEDPLRMLRAVRFAARFGFDIEEQTFAAIREASFILEVKK